LHLAELAELRKQLGVSRVLIADWQPRYNVAPSQLVPVVTVDNERVLRRLRWGLVLAGEPRKGSAGVGSSAPAQRGGAPVINARVESLATRPGFRRAFRERRCVVPATGYFEWRKQPERGGKQPLWIHPKDGSVMALAGVWSGTVSADGEIIDTFAIVTTDAPDALRAIHERVPLELRGADIDRWLAPGPLPDKTLAAMVSAAQDAEHLQADEVETHVNTPAHDDPQCIAPRGTLDAERAAELQLKLFGQRSDT
jgi:putative SOS response-associated peptidase YedK